MQLIVLCTTCLVSCMIILNALQMTVKLRILCSVLFSAIALDFGAFFMGSCYYCITSVLVHFCIELWNHGCISPILKLEFLLELLAAHHHKTANAQLQVWWICSIVTIVHLSSSSVASACSHKLLACVCLRAIYVSVCTPSSPAYSASSHISRLVQKIKHRLYCLNNVKWTIVLNFNSLLYTVYIYFL